MLTFDQQAVADALPYAELTRALARAFAGDHDTPVRVMRTVPVPGAADATLLLMPAWQAGEALGVKIVTVFPDNAQRGLASVHASYLLLDAMSGQPLALLDGTELTLRRTAAASALASTYLSRTDASTLLMVGTGTLAPHLIAAHAAVRPIERVIVWGRRPAKAAATAAGLAHLNIEVAVADSLEQAVPLADIISCATLSREPLINGAWLTRGQHLDLVGAFQPAMREADHAALQRASIFVDTLEGALSEAGEIVQGLREGVIKRADILADLPALARGTHPGRQSSEELTLFKSVGSAIEDLTAAMLVMRNSQAAQGD